MKTQSVIAVVVLVFIAQAPHADAIPTDFSSCAVMNKYFPGGVTIPGALNIGLKTKLLPFPSRTIYMSNRRLDTDRDMIVCER
jgi:hypothetical protein